MKRALLLLGISLLLFVIGVQLVLGPKAKDRAPKLVFLPPSEQLDPSNSFKNLSRRVLSFFYKPRFATISANIFSHTQLTSASVGKIIGRISVGETNGTMVWLLSPDEATKLEKAFESQKDTERIASPRIFTSEFAAGTMFMGQMVPVGGTNVEVGLSFSVLPRVKPNRTDLTFAFSWTEALTNNASAGATSIRTNASFAARAEGPRDRRLFILSKGRQGQPSVYLFIRSEPATDANNSGPATAPASPIL